MSRSQRKSGRFKHLKVAPQFPPEILDMIFSHLNYDRKTLKACSLICRAWLLPTRRHLFATVRIRDKKRYLSFHRALKSEPSLALLVRCLEIDANSPPESWANVPRTLTKLPRVQTLAIRRWAGVDIPIAFRSKLSSHCVHLRSLTLHDVALPQGDFLRMLFNCPLLRHLSATEVGLMGDTKGSQFELRKRSTLLSLDALELHDDNSDVLALLLSTPIQFQPARVFMHAAPNVVENFFFPALKKIGPGLRELVFTFDACAKSYPLELPESCSFMANPNLEFLHIKNHTAHMRDTHPNTFVDDMAAVPWTIACLCPENAHLARIIVTQRFPAKAQRTMFARHSPNWDAMDGVLAAMASVRPVSLLFQFIHRGIFKTHTMRQLTIFFDKVVETLRAKLPLYAETGAPWGVVCGPGLGKGAVYGGTVVGRRWERWFNPDEKLYFDSKETSRELAVENWKVAVSGQWSELTSEKLIVKDIN